MKAHTKEDDFFSLGNKGADELAQSAVKYLMNKINWKLNNLNTDQLFKHSK